MTKEELKYYSSLTDQQLQEEIYSGNKKAEIYLFCEKCAYVINSQMRFFFNKNQMELDEAINEIYIYMKENGWYRLRQYDGRNKASIKTWLSKIAYNFFLKLYRKMDMDWTDINMLKSDDSEYEKIEQIKKTLLRMPCIRYRIILIKIYFDDKKPIEIAKEMNVNRNYFDVLHQRAKNQFKKYYTDN